MLAAAGGAGKLRLARELGADVTADYQTPEWPAVIRAAAGGADVVFDGLAGTSAARRSSCWEAGRPAAELRAGQRRVHPG